MYNDTNYNDTSNNYTDSFHTSYLPETTTPSYVLSTESTPRSRSGINKTKATLNSTSTVTKTRHGATVQNDKSGLLSNNISPTTVLPLTSSTKAAYIPDQNNFNQIVAEPSTTRRSPKTSVETTTPVVIVKSNVVSNEQYTTTERSNTMPSSTSYQPSLNTDKRIAPRTRNIPPRWGPEGSITKNTVPNQRQKEAPFRPQSQIRGHALPPGIHETLIRMRRLRAQQPFTRRRVRLPPGPISKFRRMLPPMNRMPINRPPIFRKSFDSFPSNETAVFSPSIKRPFVNRISVNGRPLYRSSPGLHGNKIPAEAQIKPTVIPRNRIHSDIEKHHSQSLSDLASNSLTAGKYQSNPNPRKTAATNPRKTTATNPRKATATNPRLSGYSILPSLTNSVINRSIHSSSDIVQKGLLRHK